MRKIVHTSNKHTKRQLINKVSQKNINDLKEELENEINDIKNLVITKNNKVQIINIAIACLMLITAMCTAYFSYSNYLISLNQYEFNSQENLSVDITFPGSNSFYAYIKNDVDTNYLDLYKEGKLNIDMVKNNFYIAGDYEYTIRIRINNLNNVPFTFKNFEIHQIDNDTKNENIKVHSSPKLIGETIYPKESKEYTATCCLAFNQEFENFMQNYQGNPRINVLDPDYNRVTFKDEYGTIRNNFSRELSFYVTDAIRQYYGEEGIKMVIEIETTSGNKFIKELRFSP